MFSTTLQCVQYRQKKNTYDTACSQLHFTIWKETGAKLVTEHRYRHVPKSEEISQNMVKYTINQKVKTDRTTSNKPDIIMHDN